jgi:group I intron endonuclease
MINMINDDLFNNSGIYKIENLLNGHIYIGSAFNFYNRYRTHKSMLNNNKHDNKHLQRAYSKYGGNNFIFEVVECVNDLELLYEIEERYINKHFDNGVNCYNMNVSTTPEYLLNQINKERVVKFNIVGPDGTEYIFSGYTEAARKINPSGVSIQNFAAGLRLVVKGSIKSYKGWRTIENKDYDYKGYRSIKNKGAKLHEVSLLSPEGLVYSNIYNLKKFALEHKIQSSTLHNIITGRTRYSNGWSLYNGNNKPPLEKNAKIFHITLISPNGIEYNNIPNLTKFCRIHNINVSSIRKLIKGEIKAGHYKGWKQKQN